MSVTDELRGFEKKLEVAIKSAFEKALHQDDEFEISADYDTHSRINDVVRPLDLEVYGMSVTPSEFTVSFEFTGSFQKIDAKAKPNFCRISLENDGNYYLTLTEDDLKRGWYVGITDLEFNLKTVPDDVLLDCLTQLNHNLLIRVLSN
jgi:hypothetical protein